MKVDWVLDQNGNYFAYESKRCIASVTLGTKGWWPNFNHAIDRHLKPPYTTCKTLAGIKRRVEKYATLWVIAGRPEI